MKKAYPFTVIGERSVFNQKYPDPNVCEHPLRKSKTMWAIMNPDGLFLPKTVREKRWESYYVITHGYHKYPQNWKKIYYNRGYRCVRVKIEVVVT